MIEQKEDIKLIKMIISIIIVIGIILVVIKIDPILYRSEKDITVEAIDAGGYKGEFQGYPAGSNIPVISGVKDINKKAYNYKYFAIKSDKIRATGIYGIIDFSDAGTKYSTSTKRRRRKTYVPYFTNNKLSNIFNRYGQLYIVTLDDKSKVIVLLDDNDLIIKDNEEILLPIGIKATPPVENTEFYTYMKKYISENDIEYNEKLNWYINMTSVKLSNKYSSIKLCIFIFSFVLFVLFYILRKKIQN